MARAKLPVSINGIEFDALIDDSRTLANQVPSYPVEDGFSISDTIIHSPETLSMTLFLTDSAVDYRSRGHGGAGWTNSVIKQLENLYFSRETVKIVTSEATYSDMAIVDIGISISDGNGFAKQIAINFQKIETVSSRTVSIPDSYGKSGTTGANAGTASTSVSETPAQASGSSEASEAGEGSKQSIAYSIAKQAGLL